MPLTVRVRPRAAPAWAGSSAAECRLKTWQLIDILKKDSAEDPKAAIEILIARLRKKLLQAGCAELVIKSIRNWGYQMSGQLQLV